MMPNSPDRNHKPSRRNFLTAIGTLAAGAAAGKLIHFPKPLDNQPVQPPPTETEAVSAYKPAVKGPSYKNDQEKLNELIFDKSINGHYLDFTFNQNLPFLQEKVKEITPADDEIIRQILEQRLPIIEQIIGELNNFGMSFNPSLKYIMVGIIKAESDNNPQKTEPDIGLCQLRKGAVDDVQKTLKSQKNGLEILQKLELTVDSKNTSALLNPRLNITFSLLYLNMLHRQFGDWGLALTAYNYGPGVVDKDVYQYALAQAPMLGLSRDTIHEDFESSKQTASQVYADKFNLTPFSLYPAKYPDSREEMHYFLKVASFATRAAQLA